ncbi:MAG TPA: hypothetical protein VGC41_28525 [Kofleriaceae bacterium]
MRYALLAVLVACGSPTKPASLTAPPQPAPVPVVEPTDIPLPSAANGLAWDPGEKALYLAAETKLLKWSNNEFSTVAEFPSTGKLSLGGVVRLADGSFLVTSFGFGTDGGVFHVDAQHHVVAVPNLDPKRRRVGIAVGPDSAIYEAYFVVDGKEHTGGLAKLDLAKGSESEVPLGTKLTKVVGVVATKRGVFISDQDANAIYAVGNAAPIAKDLPSADMLVMLPDGALATGGKNGVVSKVSLDGTITPLAQGYESARGIAVDAEGKRLFVVEHGKDKHVLHIVKLP